MRLPFLYHLFQLNIVHTTIHTIIPLLTTDANDGAMDEVEADANIVPHSDVPGEEGYNASDEAE